MTFLVEISRMERNKLYLWMPCLGRLVFSGGYPDPLTSLFDSPVGGIEFRFAQGFRSFSEAMDMHTYKTDANF